MRTLKELNAKCESYCKTITGSIISCGWMEEPDLWNHIVKGAEKIGFSIWNTRSLKKNETITLKGRSGDYAAEIFFHLSKERISVNCVCKNLPCKTTAYVGDFTIPLTTRVMVKKEEK